jgi:hypothetical protein
MVTLGLADDSIGDRRRRNPRVVEVSGDCSDRAAGMTVRNLSCLGVHVRLNAMQAAPHVGMPIASRSGPLLC